MELAYKGGESYIRRNLFRHVREDQESYADRLDRAYYLNYCKQFIALIISYIFSREDAIHIRLPERMAYLHADADGRGTPLMLYLKRALTQTLIWGQVGITIDSPRVTTEPRTLLEQREQGLEYYLRGIRPQHITNYYQRDNGLFDWAVEKDFYYEQPTPFSPADVHTRYRVYWPDRIDTYIERSGFTFSKDTEPTFTTPHPFGQVPFWWLIAIDTDHDGVGESLLRDIHPINRNLFNLCSLIDEQAFGILFPMLQVPDGVLDDMEQEGMDPEKADEVVLSGRRLIIIPRTVEGQVTTLTPSSEPIRTILQVIEMLRLEMIRIAGMNSPGQEQAAESGLAKTIDFVDLNNTLSSIANTFAQGFETVLKTLAKALGQRPEEVGIAFPNDYNILQLQQIITDFSQVIPMVDHPAFEDRIKELLVRKALGKYFDESVVTDIVDQIQAEAV
jgi:hypothetical protein